MQHFRYIFFLGIGGIGMSALARWFRARGYAVSGYDRTETPLTQALQAEGIGVHYADTVENIPAEIKNNKAETLVVLTPAMPTDSAEWGWLREQGYDVRKRSQVLGLLTGGRPIIAVAGTHGKTTTSSMVAHLLHHAGLDVGAFLGGIAVNFDSNLVLSKTDSAPVVVEADEYDRSFLTLHPDVAIVTSTDADHLDIYGEQSALVEAFGEFVSQLKPGGTLLLHHSADPRAAAAAPAGTRVVRYGLNHAETAALSTEDLRANNIVVAGHEFRFDLVGGPGGAVPDLRLAVPGFHNVENMLAAAAVAQVFGVRNEQIRAAVASYRGVRRRFEFIVTGADKIYVDDYAHHPREIEAFLRSLRALYPDKKLRVIFQPHLFSRTRDFAAGFSQSLSLADEVVLLPIYPAREQPLPGIISEMLLPAITSSLKSLQTKAQVLENTRNNPTFDVLATVGAGDIDTLVPQLREILSK